MKIISDIHNNCEGFKSGVIAIGNFDGVHLGHQAILNTAKATAKSSANVKAGVMCFEPHPRIFFNPAKPMFNLTPINRKLRLFEAFGLDYSIVIPFDKQLAELNAADFIKEILVGIFNVSHIVVGYDFHFAKNRSGTPEFLEKAGRQFGFGTTIVEQQNAGAITYSSSQIRNFLREGKVKQAAELLGHWWRISGDVEHGAQNGQILGFPTANIKLQPGQQLGYGIYAVRVYIDNVRFLGAAYMGQRPTFDDGTPTLETFIFDFEGNLYGKSIEIELIEFIRHDQKFDSPDLLKQQMEQDCNKAKEILAKVEIQEHTIKSI